MQIGSGVLPDTACLTSETKILLAEMQTKQNSECVDQRAFPEWKVVLGELGASGEPGLTALVSSTKTTSVELATPMRSIRFICYRRCVTRIQNKTLNNFYKLKYYWHHCFGMEETYVKAAAYNNAISLQFLSRIRSPQAGRSG